MKVAKKKQLKIAIALGAGSGLRISEIVGQKQRYSKCCSAELTTKIFINKITRQRRKRTLCTKCNNKINKETDTFLSKKENDWAIPPLSRDGINLEAHQIKVVQGKGKKDRITVTSKWLNENNVKYLPLKIPQRTLQYNFTQLCKKVLGKPCNFHMLRHAFGNYMVNEKNVPIPMVQQLMGHTRIETTGVYTKANPKQAIERAWEAF